MSYPAYPIGIDWSPEDGLFVAEVADLPGCLAHGDSRSEAFDSARKAIELYVDDLRESGGKVPEPRATRQSA